MAATGQKASPSRGNSTTIGNILVIEDDPNTASTIEAILKKEGYGVRTVSSRDEALKVLDRYLYNLVIMDLYMPGMVPEEFIKVAKQRRPLAQVILTTAAEYVDVQAKRLGICRWLGKPFDPDQLLDVVRECMR